MSSIIIYAVMVVAALVMFWANQQFNNKGAAWGRPVAALAGVVAVLMAIFAIYHQFTKASSQQQNILDKEMRYQEVSMKTLGNFLKQRFAGENATAVIVRQAEMPTPGAIDSENTSENRNKRALDALREAMQPEVRVAKVINVGEEEMKKAQEQMANMPEDGSMPPDAMPPPDMMMPEMIFTAEKFDEILDGLDPSVDLVVSLMGLPMDYQAMKYWKKASRNKDLPKLVLTSQVELREQGIQAAIGGGLIVAVLTHNPQGKFDMEAPFPDTEKEAFDNRYLLISQENLQQLMKDQPGLFGE